MDHVMFLAQERIEALQLRLDTASVHLSNRMAGLRDGTASALHVLADALRKTLHSVQSGNSSLRLSESLGRLKENLQELRPSVLYDRCFIFILHEVTRTHVYLCCVCFVGGGLVGAMMGSRVRNSVAAPQKMRAIVVNSYNGLEGISVVEDVCAPRLSSREQILVQVKAAAIDSLDLCVARGYGRASRRHLNRYNPNCAGEFPVVLGRDCAGVVVAVGADVDDFAPGDEVWLSVPLHHQGTLCEYIVVKSELVALKPPEITMEAAAALPFALMQAWGAMVQQAGIDGEDAAKGKRFLIHSGVSSVGVVLVQLASLWGGHVTTTLSSSHHAQLAQMLGAHDIITCDTAVLAKELSMRDKFDVILNPGGAALHEESLKHVLPDGVVVSTALPELPADTYGVVIGGIYSLLLRLRFLVTKSRWVRGISYGHTPLVSGDILRKISPLVSAGKLQAVVDKAYNCQDAELAFQHIDKVQQVGKTVIRFSARNTNRALEMAFWQDL
uniref:Reticulon-4-interacting protein 1 homolog n=1 Tax=Hirondellea gigas TaxID=1518452 RepID=A0A6A7G0W3_9CRUS